MCTNESVQNPLAITITLTSSGDKSSALLEDNEAEYCIDNAHAADAASMWGISARDIAVCRHLRSVLPTYFGTYYEPFLGKAYFFWSICYNRGWQRSILGDVDQRRINVYEIIRSSAKPIFERLASLPVPKPTQRTPFIFENVDDEVGQVARIVRTGACLDLIRHLDAELRRNFEFRVRDLEQNRIISCRDVLNRFAGIDFVVGDYAETVKPAVAGDFVFFDLPSQFSPEEHVRAAACFRELDERGVSCVAAVPAAMDVASLYGGFEIQDVLGPAPTPKRKSKKSKVVEPAQQPVVAKFVVGRHAHKQ